MIGLGFPGCISLDDFPPQAMALCGVPTVHFIQASTMSIFSKIATARLRFETGDFRRANQPRKKIWVHDMNHQNTGWLIYRNPCIMVYEIIPLQLGITGYYSISSIIIPYILEIARNNQSFFIAQMSVGRAPLAFKQIKFQQLTVKEKTSP